MYQPLRLNCIQPIFPCDQAAGSQWCLMPPSCWSVSRLYTSLDGFQFQAVIQNFPSISVFAVPISFIKNWYIWGKINTSQNTILQSHLQPQQYFAGLLKHIYTKKQWPYWRNSCPACPNHPTHLYVSLAFFTTDTRRNSLSVFGSLKSWSFRQLWNIAHLIGFQNCKLPLQYPAFAKVKGYFCILN